MEEQGEKNQNDYFSYWTVFGWTQRAATPCRNTIFLQTPWTKKLVTEKNCYVAGPVFSSRRVTCPSVRQSPLEEHKLLTSVGSCSIADTWISSIRSPTSLLQTDWRAHCSTLQFRPNTVKMHTCGTSVLLLLSFVYVCANEKQNLKLLTTAGPLTLPQHNRKVSSALVQTLNLTCTVHSLSQRRVAPSLQSCLINIPPNISRKKQISLAKLCKNTERSAICDHQLNSVPAIFKFTQR